jgi:hypothetical protein
VKALLLASGPSLERFPGRRDDHDVVIAVNGAVAMCPVDWWVFGDLPIYRTFAPSVKPSQALFVKHDWPDAELLRQDAIGVKRHPRLVYAQANEELGITLKQSGPAALALAVMLHADLVECWGVDMEGPWGRLPDSKPPRRPEEERWIEERELWDYLADMTEVVRR